MTELILGFVLRLVPLIAASAPTILIGVFLAGVFEHLLGYDLLRRVFGGASLRSLFVAWLLGMLLPVCSFGVLPPLFVLRRAGLSGGTLLAFALSAPLFNPLSLLYGLTLSRPLVIMVFAACSLGIVTLVGLLWDRLFPESETPAEPPAEIPPGWRRLAAVGLTGLRELGGPTLLACLIGMTGSALLAAILPHGAYQMAVNFDQPLAPVAVLPISVFCYSTPLQIMGQLGSMFAHGNSVGAALVLLVLGTGLQLGTLAWMVREFGFVRAATFLALVLAIVVSLAYAVNGPLHPRDIEPANHTHAFDGYTNPFPAGATNLASNFAVRLSALLGWYEWLLLSLLAGLVLGALALQNFDSARSLEAWLAAPPEPDAEPHVGSYDAVLPGPVVGVSLLTVVVLFSLGGCYVFYPCPADLFEELAPIQAEALYHARRGHLQETETYLAKWDELTRKLEVGVYLREFAVSDFRRMKGRALRDKLELLKHEVEDGDQAAVDELVAQVVIAQRRLRAAYLTE